MPYITQLGRQRALKQSKEVLMSTTHPPGHAGGNEAKQQALSQWQLLQTHVRHRAHVSWGRKELRGLQGAENCTASAGQPEVRRLAPETVRADFKWAPHEPGPPPGEAGQYGGSQKLWGSMHLTLLWGQAHTQECQDLEDFCWLVQWTLKNLI